MRIKIAQEGGLEKHNHKTQCSPIIFGLMITINCISAFCGLVQDAGPMYGHAMT